jgi:hypothetical protein
MLQASFGIPRSAFRYDCTTHLPSYLPYCRSIFMTFADLEDAARQDGGVQATDAHSLFQPTFGWASPNRPTTEPPRAA